MKKLIPPINVDKLAQVIDYLVDKNVGIIKEVREGRMEPGFPSLYYYYAQACDTTVLGYLKNYSLTSGVSIYREIALAKAVGEAVERYCSAIYDEASLSYVSKKEASFKCLDPHLFNFYSEAQFCDSSFPFVPFNEETRVRWASALELNTNQLCAVPAQLVYVPYLWKTDPDSEPIFSQPFSTGLSCHGTYEEAALSSICEVIERDAFSITWQAGLSRPQIALESLTPINLEIVKRIKTINCQLNLFDITTDSQIPTILAVIRGSQPNSPALVVATSTDINPEAAVRKSLEELALTWRYAQNLMSTTPSIKNTPPNFHIQSQSDHVRFWCDHQHLPLASFLFASSQTVDFNSLPHHETGNAKKNLEIIKEKIAATGYKIYLVDITTPDISSLGLFVLRALIPGYHPLRIGHQIRALGGKRLWEVPQKLGYSRIYSEGKDHGLPHPFP